MGHLKVKNSKIKKTDLPELHTGVLPKSSSVFYNAEKSNYIIKIKCSTMRVKYF